MRLTARAAARSLAGLPLLLGCSAGTPPEPAGPALEVGHGSVEEVLAALSEQGLPCTGVEPAGRAEYEESVTCVLEGEQVVLVHFLDVEQAREFEAQRRATGEPGVYTDTWAAEVESEGLAADIGAAIAATRTG